MAKQGRQRKLFSFFFIVWCVCVLASTGSELAQLVGNASDLINLIDVQRRNLYFFVIRLQLSRTDGRDLFKAKDQVLGWGREEAVGPVGGMVECGRWEMTPPCRQVLDFFHGIRALTFYWLKKKILRIWFPHFPFYLRKMKVFLVENVFNTINISNM